MTVCAEANTVTKFEELCSFVFSLLAAYFTSACGELFTWSGRRENMENSTPWGH